MLVISLDGMGPGYLLEADGHGLRIPTLRKLLRDGTYSAAVAGVVPTLTYPSHTTLITGVWPSVHGIHNNRAFDPFGGGAKHTDASLVRAETLWHAASKAGYTTANVGWPVTTRAPGVDWLMPANAAFERKTSGATGSPSPDSPRIHYDNPPGLRELLAPDIPDEASLDVDARRFAWSLAILRRYQPEFMTVHIGILDSAQHQTGPFSPESKAAIELVDHQVGRLIVLERSIDPDSYIIVVSDHGLIAVDKAVHLGILFAQHGLLVPASATEPARWDAALWNAGGSTAVMLRNPTDDAVRVRVETLLRDAGMEPAYGIARILTCDEVHRIGGCPEAAFVVEFKPGFETGDRLTGDVVESLARTRGNHGFLPDHAELRSCLMINGPGVAAGRDLGLIDLRQIAPTLARILGIHLPMAHQAPLRYEL